MAVGVSTAPPKGNVAQGSLSSLAAFLPRRDFDGAAHDNSDYLVGDAARTRVAGRAAGPDRGPCATYLLPPLPSGGEEATLWQFRGEGERGPRFGVH